MSEHSDRPSRRGRHGQDVAVEEDRSEPPITGELRIDAPPAGVAAGLEDVAPAATEPSPPPGERADPASATEAFDLPNWADPPTGQVPKVLLEQSDFQLTESGEALRGPTWRQESEGFNDPDDLSFLVPEEGPDQAIAGAVEPVARPFEFRFSEPDEAGAEGEGLPGTGDEAAWTTLLGAHEASARRRHAQHRARGRARNRGGAPVSEPGKRNLALATLTGLVLAGIVVACLALSAPLTLALVAVATAIASGEAFAVAQRAGLRPATMPCLLAVPALALGAYWHGPEGAFAVAAAAFVVLAGWFLLPGTGRETVANFGLSAFVVAWVGLGGVSAALLLRPGAHPHHHGQALLGAVILLVVVDDVAAYLVGSRLGRHRLAPAISPGKSIEGLIGGTVVCLAVAALVGVHLHPLHLGSALGLGAIAAVVAPAGDLLESRVKRDLGVKDMGTLLPAHGGLFDRIDALLLVLPAAYLFITGLGLR